MTKDKETFDKVYGYEFGTECTYSSFKILYNSKEFISNNDYKRLQLCLVDFLAELSSLKSKTKKDDLQYLIDSVYSIGLEKFIERRCKMIESQNNPTLGKEQEYNKGVEDRHLFYKIKLSSNFILELEDYKPRKLDEMTQNNEGMISFFKEEDLNKIVERFRFNPDYISVFSLKQIEYGIGNVIFQKMFEELKKKINLEDLTSIMRKLKKK